MFRLFLQNYTWGLSQLCSIMFYLGLYYQTLDLTKTKGLLNLGSAKFCDSVFCPSNNE
jgi:hypothetical protein